MSSQDGDDMDVSHAMASDDIPMSPISAADLLSRSRRMSRRTLNETSTPAKRLFPENIDILAPGMTPTSRNQKKRKSSMANRTPRRSARISAVTFDAPDGTPGPSSSRKRDESTIVERYIASEVGESSPISTPIRTSTPSRPPRTPTQAVGKKRARESDDSTSRILTFGDWGQGREESPMEMLRRLAQAPGQLSSPIDERSVFMPSISDRLNGGIASVEQRGGQGRASSSRPSRHSAADTSIPSSDVGQGRRAARQSAMDNIFSDLTQQGDASGNRTFLSNRKSDAFTLRGDLTNLPIEEEEASSSRLDLMDATKNREEELERRIANESTRQIRGFNTSPNTTRRLESLSVSYDNNDDSGMPFETGYDAQSVDRGDDTTILSRRDDQIDPRLQDETTIMAGNEDETLQQDERQYDFNQADDETGGINASVANEMRDDSSIDSEESSEDEVLDQSKEIRAARISLLRKRRAKKKAKRYSTVTGNPVPSLSSDLVKGLFTSFTTPNTAVGSIPMTKGKIKIEKGAAEAVEDLSHLFFTQFSQALIAQADETGKSRIIEKDIVNLMKSQGQISARNTLPFLARRYLPRELSDLITSTTVNDATSKQQRGSKRKKAVTVMDNSIDDTIDRTQD